MKSKVFAATLLTIPLVAAAACSDTASSSPDVADAADGSRLPETSLGTGSDGTTPERGPTDSGRDSSFDGGVVCTTRCTKANCPDLEACVDRCNDQAATIPASCDPYVVAVDTCIDAKGSWKCDRGEAKGTGPCAAEAAALLQCVLSDGRDAGLDAQPDAGGDADDAGSGDAQADEGGGGH